MEQDSQTQALLQESAGFEWADNIIQKANQMAEQFERTEGMSISDYIIAMRDREITQLLADCVTEAEKKTESTTNKIDRFVLNRWAAPLFLVLDCLSDLSDLHCVGI